MPLPYLAWVAIAAVGFAALWKLASQWIKYHGDRLITCPENRRPAGVRVDAGRAALHSLGRTSELRLSSCSRWPERAGCGQECLSQIETAPEDCLVRNILTKWYEGKTCAACGRPVGEIHVAGSQPALLLADKVTMEWKQVPVDQLPATLADAAAICFACHMANTLVREHPELAIDRARPAEIPGIPAVHSGH